MFENKKPANQQAGKNPRIEKKEAAVLTGSTTRLSRAIAG
jgi:hypothetical protein